MHCHHKKPRKQGGTDKYENLMFVTDTIHKLIHLKNEVIIDKYLSTLKLNEKQLNKLNELRLLSKGEIATASNHTCECVCKTM